MYASVCLLMNEVKLNPRRETTPEDRLCQQAGVMSIKADASCTAPKGSAIGDNYGSQQKRWQII